jgi:hypothetical protein
MAIHLFVARSVLALFGTTLFIGTTFGQAAPPPKSAPAADSGHAYRVKQVIGSKVSIQGELSIGTVDDLVFADSGQVEYLIVANEGKLVTVPWEAAKFNFEKQTATINITQKQYQEIPTYTVREYPVYFEPTYRTRVYGWYGLKPRPFRR